MPNEGEGLATFDVGVLASTAATSPLTGTLDVPDAITVTSTESTGILERVGVLEFATCRPLDAVLEFATCRPLDTLVDLFRRDGIVRWVE